MRSFTLETEAVSARVVLCESVFVAESDDVFREEGARAMRHWFAWGATIVFFKFFLRSEPANCLDSCICAAGQCVVAVVESFADHVDSWTNAWPYM
eukprot:2974271-Prymnesium_polylepis.1